MSELTIEERRDVLRGVGAVPLGSVEPKHSEVTQPRWNFYCTGPGSMESIMGEVFSLFDRLGVVRSSGGPLDSELSGGVDHYVDSFAFPLLDLEGEKSSLRVPMTISCRTASTSARPTGHAYSQTLGVDLRNHWLAPLGRGAFHDNRPWARVNNTALRSFFVGLSELGCSAYPPWREDSQISPLDAFGFASVDVDSLKEQLAERWRSVVEGHVSLEGVKHIDLNPTPKLPVGNPMWWSMLGFDWDSDELSVLFDGVAGGEEAVRRVLPCMSAVQSAQVIGDRNELLAAGVELRDQLAVALSGVDRVLSGQLRSLPVVVEDLGYPANVQHLSPRSIGDRLAAGVPRAGSSVAKLYGFEAGRICRWDPFVATHLFAPIIGADYDLSAAVDLWKLSGRVGITEECFNVGLQAGPSLKGGLFA